MQLSSMSPQYLAQIDPAQVRVRLSVPQGYAIDIDASQLALTYGDNANKTRLAMHLQQRGGYEEKRPGKFFRKASPVKTYLLALTPEAAHALRQHQPDILASRNGRFEFDITTSVIKQPEGATEVIVWADLQLTEHAQFLQLIDGATIPLDS